MPTDLERIEARWKGYGAIESDVVKLARALASLIQMHMGGANAVGNWDLVINEAQRILHEVAGGDDVRS